MVDTTLPPEEIARLVGARHHAPRSVLGFHEIGEANSRRWVIRVLEPDAETVEVVWHPDDHAEPVALERIDAGGLFEISLAPRDTLRPYELRIRWPNGAELTRHDPYYFAPQLTDLDLYLYAEGNHHRIYYKLGAHPDTRDGVDGTRFAVWAPAAERVSVVGDFNLWDGRRHALHARDASGIWELFVPGVGVGAIYKYEIKTAGGPTLLKADPYGFQMQVRPDNCSVVADLDTHDWQDDDWMNARARTDPLAGPVNIYEVHPASWKRFVDDDERFFTWDELAEELIPYVVDAGYTHIELMGVAEHPFDGSWGYQVVGYFAATARHGEPAGLMRFVDACHRAGIGVIMDWVPAHFPKDAHGLRRFDGTAVYEHDDPRKGEHRDWGTAIFNYGRHEVRNFLIANALFWMDRYHVDGIRVDAVASMLYLDYSREDGDWIPNEYGGRENLEAIQFLKLLNRTLFHYYPGILSIAEESTAFPGVTKPVHDGGLGFNLKWNMGWMNDTLRYIELDPVHRKYEGNLLTFSLVYAWTENFMLPISHDEVVHGKGALLAKMPGDDWQKRANFRLYNAFKIAHPGKQLMFMGSEFGQTSEWCETRSLDWHLLDTDEHAGLADFSRVLNRFYIAEPALYSDDFSPGGFQWIECDDHDRSVYAFVRRPADGSEPVVFVFNFTPVPRDGYRLGVPAPGRYGKLLDSDETRFGGSGYNAQRVFATDETPWQNQPCSLELALPPLGAIALKRLG